MRIGQIIDFSFQSHRKWVVVSINDCRASIVPLSNRDPNDPNAVFEEFESGSTGISPNSSCRVLGVVAGQIKTRKPIVYSKLTSPVTQEKPKVVRPIPKILLPSVPEDPQQDPLISAVVTATCRSLF
jgi:hypothetical protein